MGKKMKIAGTGPVQTTSARRRKESARSADTFAGEIGAEKSVKEASPVMDVTSAASLLTLQEVENFSEGRRRAVKRGMDLLDRLDELRHGLLIGAFPPAKLDHLLAVVRRQQSSISDPKLREILAEIEIRAAVELAKLGRL